MNVSIDIHEDPELADIVKSLALEGYEPPKAVQFESCEKFKWLRELGSSLWLDTGDANAAGSVWSRELEALTTNNTLVYQVVKTGEMDEFISSAAGKIRKSRPDISTHDLVIEIAFLVNARLALSLVQRFGAHVSVELHPDVGFDVHRTVAFARRYYAINPEYFYVKAPLTPDGYIAVRRLASEGIPINFTLGFSARQNYLAALLSNPRYVNVFLGRLNSLVEENGLGKPENIGEKSALASWEAIKSIRESRSGISTRQIAASMRSGEQVVTLAGMDVHTIPPKAAKEYLEMDISKEDVRVHKSTDLEVNLNQDKQVEIEGVRKLWEIDEQFIAFVEDACSQGDQLQSGRDLIELSVRHGVGLFGDWTESDRLKIRQKGKIPKTSEWPGAPIDDLMSISALESFTVDQQELDARIEGLIDSTG